MFCRDQPSEKGSQGGLLNSRLTEVTPTSKYIDKLFVIGKVKVQFSRKCLHAPRSFFEPFNLAVRNTVCATQKRHSQRCSLLLNIVSPWIIHIIQWLT